MRGPRLKKYFALQHPNLALILFFKVRTSELQHRLLRLQDLNPVGLQQVVLLDRRFVFLHLHQLEIGSSDVRDENAVRELRFEFRT